MRLCDLDPLPFPNPTRALVESWNRFCMYISNDFGFSLVQTSTTTRSEIVLPNSECYYTCADYWKSTVFTSDFHRNYIYTTLTFVSESCFLADRILKTNGSLLHLICLPYKLRKNYEIFKTL